MKPTDFSVYLTAFLSDYLPAQKNASQNTVKSYRDAFKLLLKYFEEVEGIPAEKLEMSVLSKSKVLGFLDWLETERNCSITTRNLRLTAIHSFFRYAQMEAPESLFHFQKVISIPVKRGPKKNVAYLSAEGVQILLQQPDRTTSKGRRDLTLLSVLYDSGSRVQELIDLSVGNFILNATPILVLTGKGNKVRRVPLMENTSKLLSSYIYENRLNLPHKQSYPLFFNNQHNRLTREGVSYILNKYAVKAHAVSESVPKKMKCHMLRHSKAVHLLQAGVNLIYIRDFLGHTNIKTTEIYARADTELKRKALENAYPDLVDSNLPDWKQDQDLMSWLSKL
jgi:site-specific recombinase XerD